LEAILHSLIDALIRLTDALASFSDEWAGLSNLPHGPCNSRNRLARVTTSLVVTANGLIEAFVRLGTALVRVSITAIEVRCPRTERVNELMGRRSSRDDRAARLSKFEKR
jgi:hypothetical protein